MRWAQSTTHGVSLHYVPVDVADSSVRSSKAHTSAWICTSATLAVGDSFDHFMGRLGMREATTVRFGSPFSYERQTLLYLPRGPDPPSSPRTRPQVDRRRGAGSACRPAGDAFLLFTESSRAARRGRDTVARLGATLPFPVLVQGDATARIVAAEVSRIWQRRAARHQQLLGRRRREGRGAAVVVIDKLPFASPDDPLMKARLEHRAARRQPVPRIAVSRGSDRAEAGRRAADARSERLRRRHALRSAAAYARLRPDLSARACRRCRARERIEEVEDSCTKSSPQWALDAAPAFPAPGRAMKLLAIDTATERCSVALPSTTASSSVRWKRHAVTPTSCCRWSTRCCGSGSDAASSSTVSRSVAGREDSRE